MRQGITFLALTLLALPTLAGTQVALRIDGNAAGLQGLPMSLDGVFVGVVGDTISVSRHAHSLSVELPQGISATHEIFLNSGLLSMQPVSTSECSDNIAWSIGSWKAPGLQRQGDVMVVTLTKPTPILMGTCPDGLHYPSCFLEWTNVAVRAEPEVQAEIWLDGHPIGTATSATLKLQHCAGSIRTINVVLRKEGYANCSMGIVVGQLPADDKVSCNLRKL